ncbi:MAG: HAMP domain-containing sensor histidine kinase [Pirellulaceae bacterium]
MLSRCPIRYKLMLGVALLLITVAALSFGGFRGVYAYRQLAKGISSRSTELPLADDLSRRVSELRVTLSKTSSHNDFPGGGSVTGVHGPFLREEFRTQFEAAKQSLKRYRNQLRRVQADDPQIGNNRREQETAAEIARAFDRIVEMNRDEDWMLDEVKSVAIDEELERVHQLSAELPGYLRSEMESLARDVRSQYHTWIAQTWISTIMVVVVLVVLVRFFRRWVFGPLDLLVAGSRRVAQGEFEHRIELDTHDEMAELADALNDMTKRFCEIRDDLDRKVKLRTREALQSEKLASVGFLAAGVAHEINNPLASIAWCAESLETRLHDLLLDYDDDEEDPQADDEMRQEVEVLRKYLRRIQDEAFRCKGITDGLLDYSRMGDVEKHATNLPQLVEGVLDMVRHLGKNREKKIVFACDEPVIAPVNPQEIKQVVLNLVTNALDSLDPGGEVTVDLQTVRGQAELLVTDNGCGMAEDTLKHIFEPFFTRRRDGQGTGLGLSITYRIVTEHGGAIEAVSDGLGHGSQFRVTLPLVKHETKKQERKQAA